MQKRITLRLLPSEAGNEIAVKSYIASSEAVTPDQVYGYTILKRSIDARSRQTWINLTLQVFINEPFQRRTLLNIDFKDVSGAEKKVIIVGAGPAGLFAALHLIENGIQPIILERGKDVRARRRDLALLNKEGIVNPESNYCFGEGGAGTYSDGKLYTRSNKRGNIDRILSIFVHFGAEENILYDAHPHIGTNKLPQIITAMRHTIEAHGGIFLFEKKVVDFVTNGDIITGVKSADNTLFSGDAVILATGHSARDIFQLLYNRKIRIDAKSFALGVRIEHPQGLIDQIQYHQNSYQRATYLPPASYSLVEQVNEHGVFSFCMCPGGIIAPAATNVGELVVNGWSPSKRNNPFANSGMVVNVEEKDIPAFQKYGALCMMHFQQSIEQKAFIEGGGKFVAPAQRMADFSEKKYSSSLPGCSYLPGIQSSLLSNVLPGFIYQSLSKGLKKFGEKMRGYYTNEAIVVATESRTSSPVRIPRDNNLLTHPQIKNLYPCGEGAGYAGGIVSAAMDGENIAKAVEQALQVTS